MPANAIRIVWGKEKGIAASAYGRAHCPIGRGRREEANGGRLAMRPGSAVGNAVKPGYGRLGERVDRSDWCGRPKPGLLAVEMTVASSCVGSARITGVLRHLACSGSRPCGQPYFGRLGNSRTRSLTCVPRSIGVVNRKGKEADCEACLSGRMMVNYADRGEAGDTMVEAAAIPDVKVIGAKDYRTV
ncbi:hypothetical protein Tco_1123229 [Tanacetum coccineum]|uniref:Uncharacterized protein n=1 Tax=Tanacetum coccineum TaxID=301880 RepID=A0ABQ5D8E4_9ASTR